MPRRKNLKSDSFEIGDFKGDSSAECPEPQKLTIQQLEALKALIQRELDRRYAQNAQRPCPRCGSEKTRALTEDWLIQHCNDCDRPFLR